MKHKDQEWTIKSFLWPRLESVEDAKEHLETAGMIAGFYVLSLVIKIIIGFEGIGASLIYTGIVVILGYLALKEYYWAAGLLALIGISEMAFRLYLAVEYDVRVGGITVLIFLYSVTLIRSTIFLFLNKKTAFDLQNIKNRLVKSYQINDIKPIKFSNNEKIKSLSKLPSGSMIVIFVIFSIGALVLMQKISDQNDAKEIKKVDYVYTEKKLTAYDFSLKDNTFSATVVNDIGKIIVQLQLFYKEGECGKPTRAMVALAQQKLKNMGFRTGQADGIYGPKTRQAVKEYQRSKSYLTNSGNLDDATLEDLSIDSEIGYRTIFLDTLIFINTTERVTFKLPSLSSSQICWGIWTNKLIK